MSLRAFPFPPTHAEAAGHLEPTRQELLLFAVPGRNTGVDSIRKLISSKLP